MLVGSADSKLPDHRAMVSEDESVQVNRHTDSEHDEHSMLATGDRIGVANAI
jgi:hypothetical protein